MTQRASVFSRVVSSVAIVLVLAFSLALLVYVGYGEARRTYPRFEMDKLAAQGELVKNNLESFVLAGLPIQEFPGFTTIARPVLESDRAIGSVYVARPGGELIFSNPQTGLSLSGQTAGYQPATSLQDKSLRYDVTENTTYYRVSLPLKNKFETVGNLHITLPKIVIEDKINASFEGVLWSAVGLLVAYALLVGVGTQWLGTGRRWLPASYSLTFLLMSVIVVVTLVNLYSAGIEGKTRALANSLAQRLSVPLELGLDINTLSRLDETLKEYKDLNRDLSYVALTDSGKVLIHTDPARVGGMLQPDSSQFELGVALKQAGVSLPVRAELGIPRSIIIEKLWRGVKNFAALFVATMLVSLLFFNLINAYRRFAASPPQRRLAGRAGFLANLIGPIFFINVFADAVMTSFLPQHFREMATRQGVDSNLVPALFTVWFLAFALCLVPASRLAENGQFRLLFVIAGLSTLAKPLGLIFFDNFYLLFILQALAGFGQGATSVGVQSYLLQLANKTNQTRNASVLIFGFNGGVIAAVAIGGLLVADPALGREGVFITGAVVAIVALLYIGLLVPKSLEVPEAEVLDAEDGPPTASVTFAASQVVASTITPAAPVTPPSKSRQRMWDTLLKTFKDIKFVKASVLISIPTKMISAGLITATLPAILAQQKYLAEDIAQLLMVYSAGVLISNRLTAYLADRFGRVAVFLFLGALGSGAGLILIGLSGSSATGGDTVPLWLTALLITGLAGLGLAHGCIQAPSVTYVANTPTARTLGKTSATSIYRLYERVGNVTGPILISQVLLLAANSTVAISWVGGVIIVFGLLFAALRFGSDTSEGEGHKKGQGEREKVLAASS